MIRFSIASILIISGLLLVGVATLGIFRFHYVLNRMHVATISDTLGAILILSGLIIVAGLSFTTLKLILIIVFLWLASPVASHLISKTEVLTNPQYKNECEMID